MHNLCGSLISQTNGDKIEFTIKFNKALRHIETKNITQANNLIRALGKNMGWAEKMGLRTA